MERFFVAVLRSEQVEAGPPGELGFHLVEAGGEDVLVTRLPGGRVVAFAAVCPHQDTPLDGATLFEGRLRCGRHLYLYDLDTGENVLPAREAAPGALRKLKPGYLPLYAVEERDGWVWVADGPEPPPPAWDPAAEQPLPAGAPAPAPAPAAPEAPAGPVGPEVVTVRVGEQFELVVPTTLRPAHLWRSAVASPAVAVVSEAFAPDAPPRHVAKAVARAAGEAEVVFTYVLPWGGDPADTRVFVVRVEP